MVPCCPPGKSSALGALRWNSSRMGRPWSGASPSPNSRRASIRAWAPSLVLASGSIRGWSRRYSATLSWKLAHAKCSGVDPCDGRST